jgi:hypothetical protein
MAIVSNRFIRESSLADVRHQNASCFNPWPTRAIVKPDDAIRELCRDSLENTVISDRIRRRLSPPRRTSFRWRLDSPELPLIPRRDHKKVICGPFDD